MNIEFKEKESQNLLGLLLADLIRSNLKKLGVDELELANPIIANIVAGRMSISLLVNNNNILIDNNLRSDSHVNIKSSMGALLKANNLLVAFFYIILCKLKISGNLLLLWKVRKLFFV